KKLLILAAVIASAGSALAQDAVTVVTPDGVTWKDSPDMPKGGQVAFLVGDPTKAEVIVLRVKMPASYQVAQPQTHYADTITVISVSLGNGMGEKFEKKGEMLKPGSFFALPAKHAHFVWTGNEEVIIQVQFVGPAVIDYINPADDPR